MVLSVFGGLVLYILQQGNITNDNTEDMGLVIVSVINKPQNTLAGYVPIVVDNI